jgi:thiosulfate/3-mercaptopyruvate sulfurtransferase
MNKPLVSIQWLKDNLNQPSLVVLDASVPKVGGGGNTHLDGKMIPGARFMDLKKDFSEAGAEFPNTFPDPIQFEKAACALGINKEDTIVVYDREGIYSSPRAWWLFKTMGHENVFVLDGGLPEWLNAGLEVEERQVSEEYPKGNFEANLQEDSVKDFHFIKENIASKECLVIDARSKGRFDGIAAEPREGLPSGHIPGSLNLPYQAVLNGNKFKPPSELKSILDEVFSTEKELVFSCGSGLTACIILLAAHLALPNKTAVYDGSWTEWASKEGENGLIDTTI